MNIWVEYYKYTDNRWENPAQMKEYAKYIPPDKKDIHKRFFPDKEKAMQFCKQMYDAGYHAVMKMDGGN